MLYSQKVVFRERSYKSDNLLITLIKLVKNSSEVFQLKKKEQEKLRLTNSRAVCAQSTNENRSNYLCFHLFIIYTLPS